MLDVGVFAQRKVRDARQAHHHFCSALRTSQGIVLKQRHHELAQGLRNFGRKRRRCTRLGSPVFAQCRHGAGWVRVLTEQGKVCQGAECVQVGASIQRLLQHRLRRGVWRRADRIAGHAHLGHRSEVQQLRAPICGPADVARGHVTVQQPSRMNHRKRGGDIQQEPTNLAPGKRRELTEVDA